MTILLKYWKQILAILAILVIIVLSQMLQKTITERNRAEENVRQLQLTNSTLTLTTSEFKDLLKTSEQRQARHVDSLLKANKINVKSVNEVHTITNSYKDTTIVKMQIPPQMMTPVQFGDKCFGFKWMVKGTELSISDKYFNIESDIVDYAKPKKFLFIRIGWNKPELKAFTDCGTITVKSYKRFIPQK